MTKKLIALLLAVVLALGAIPFIPTASAAATEREALGEINIFNGGVSLNYLTVNGKVKTQDYTYYLYESPVDGTQKEIPAYCVNPYLYGVSETVEPGQSIKYNANEKAKDPKITGIVANGYPTRSLEELKVNDKYEAYYSTKTALWCYLLSTWNIGSLAVNPKCSDQAAAKRVLAAAKEIYSRGMGWTTNLETNVTCTPDKSVAYPVTINGEEYYQQIFSINSETWICDYIFDVSFAKPDAVPEGAKIVNMDDEEITSVTTSKEAPYSGVFKVIYPASSIQGESGTVQIALSGRVYQYAIFYSVCAEKSKYGDLQNYMATTDPIVPARISVMSTYGDETPPPPNEDEEPDNGSLRIVKLENGTEIPLSGAVFEVKGPDGDVIGSFASDANGEITVPDAAPGSYTVTELTPPAGHLLCDRPTQTVTVPEGGTATLTFYNDPYGSLTVQKYSDTGEGLEGVTVQIKNIVTGETQSAKTGPGGTATFDQLVPGAYEVQETAGIKGWQADTQTIKNVTVVAGETSTVTLTNKELPGLRVLKIDRKSGQVLPDVTFEVWRDGKLLGTYKTNALGEILITDAQPGTYLVKEVQSDDAHITETTPQQVELHAGDGIKQLVFFNDLKPGLHLTKVDSANPSKVIPNAVFEIKSVDGTFGPKEFTTGADGSIDLSKLDPGAYVVTEKSCPGYVIDDAQRIIQLDGNENAEFVFTNSKKPSLDLLKVSADGTPLAGVSFRLARIADGTHYLDRTTDSNGEILWEDLEPGVYSLVETATLDDHIISTKEHHIELFPGKTSTIVLENDRRPNLVIHKRDADTGDPVPDTVYLVESADGHSVQEVKTGADGTATVENLLPGVYQITEKSVPSPYLLDAPSQLVTLYPNRDRHAYFENHKAPTIEIIKEDSITHNRLSNVRFQVWYASNSTATGEYNDLGVYTTDENGRIELDGPTNGLKDGWFRVKELEPPKGYSIKDSDTQEAFIQAGKGHTFYFQNTPLSAIVVWKYDDVTSEAIEGCTFRVSYLGGDTSGTGGTVIGTYRTSANGSFTVTGLQAGYYIIEEISSDSDHVISSSPQTVYISGKDQDVVQVFFGNTPKGSLLIRKVCSVNPSVTLQDAEFKVTYADGSVIGESNGIYRSDENGEVRIDGLIPGKSVVVTETRAPDGYLIDTQSQTIVIQAGKTVSVTMKNQPKGQLVLQKRDSVTGQPLAGAEFRITTAAGCEVGLNGVIGTSTLTQNGLFTTDSNGEIRISNLAPGTYVLTETRAPDGYLMDSPSTNVVIGANGDTQTVVVTNTPLGGLLIKKMDSVTKAPLSDVTVKVTRPDGSVVGTSNGEYRTDEQGFISIPDLAPGAYIVQEVKARPGYLLDDTPKTIEIKDHQLYTLELFNQPLGNLIIQKLDGSNRKTPLEGVQFKITYADGSYLPDEGGKLSSNGLYFTNKDGQIILSGVTGTIVVTEEATIDGYTIDPNTRSQTVVVNPGDTQTLYFYNDPVGGIELLKVSEADKTERIPNVTFEIRKMDDALVDTITTDKDGRAFLSLEDGSYYAVEIEAPKEFKVDPTPIYFEIKDGKTVTKTVTNKPYSGILIHKTDSVTGQGIYAVKFLVYDANKNPIGEYTTDQDGYIYIDDLTVLGKGKLYIRELEAAPGYELDKEYKTVYVQPGKTIEIEWQNTPITGQIQVYKYAAEANEVTGTAAGTPLQGAVYEISEARSGKVVDYITTDARGIAASKPLPLGRYKITEVTPPAYWQLSGKVFDETLEYSGQIIKVSDYDMPAKLGVTITKRGNAEGEPGSQMRYVITVANTSNVPLESFYWHDRIPTDATRATVFTTGTYSARLNYRVLYKTNYSSDYQVLASNLLTSSNYSFNLAAIPMQAGEVITDIYLDFGKVPVGFQSATSPTLTVQILGTVPNGYQIVNRADVGGKYQGTWQTAQASWVTVVRRVTPTPTLPKTGY